jgi:hypothetical protein
MRDHLYEKRRDVLGKLQEARKSYGKKKSAYQERLENGDYPVLMRMNSMKTLLEFWFIPDSLRAILQFVNRSRLK